MDMPSTQVPFTDVIGLPTNSPFVYDEVTANTDTFPTNIPFGDVSTATTGVELYNTEAAFANDVPFSDAELNDFFSISR